MFSIITSAKNAEYISRLLSTHPALKEKVCFLDESTAVKPSAFYIHITNEIILPLDWYNDMPPLLPLAPILFNENNLLGILYGKTGDMRKALTCCNDNKHLKIIMTLLYHLQNALVIPNDTIENILSRTEYRSYHNAAIALHYGNNHHNPNEVIAGYYEQALAMATNDEYAAFTGKHYALFCMDTGHWEKAEKIILGLMKNALTTDAEIELKSVLSAIRIKQLSIPYDKKRINELKITLREIGRHYEQSEQKTRIGLILTDASYVASISHQFTEALRYINKSIDLFKEEQQLELLASAQIRKGSLLLAWAQSGHTEFYRSALQTYQQALKMITQEKAPDIFADIHHHLGIIYAEFPDEAKKKSLWASLSAASFKEALSFFNKVDYPYQFAIICNNFGNAYTKYPASVHTNNYDKALQWYRESLNIRTAEKYPQQRAYTLLNYLEAGWYADNDGNEMLKIQTFKKMAEEILVLTKDEVLLTEVRQHITRLNELEKEFI